MKQGRRDATATRTQGTRVDERGAVALEFALIMPLLVMLMMGITTAGLSYSHSIGLTNAVREGARYGATAVPSDVPAVSATWSPNVIAQVRGTQFDDATEESGVCVQLWKVGTTVGTGSSLGGACQAGEVSGLSLPTTAAQSPAVPDSVPPGACVVRIIAGRNFTINIGLTAWNRVTTSTSVARYERGSDGGFPTCA